MEDERAKEYEAREAAEVVAFGELMKTHIAFYVDRSFVNDYQMENIRIVAEFLKKHPELEGVNAVEPQDENYIEDCMTKQNIHEELENE